MVNRPGEISLPVDVDIRFADGSTTREHWDGVSRYVLYTFTRPSRAVSAVVDPEHRIALDVNILNNSKTLEPSSGAANKYFAKILFWVQNLFQMTSIF